MLTILHGFKDRTRELVKEEFSYSDTLHLKSNISQASGVQTVINPALHAARGAEPGPCQHALPRQPPRPLLQQVQAKQLPSPRGWVP